MFGRKNNQKNKNKQLKVLSAILALVKTIGCIFLWFPQRWQKFIKGQKREINELSTGKEDWSKFLADSKILVKDLFIPYDGNGNRPKVLRPKSLISYLLIAITVKLFVTVFLFITYPTPAELSAIISANMVNLINESRVEAGIEPLQENVTLAKFAEIKGQDMITRDYFSHDTPEGKRPWQWIDRGEYDYVYAGENLAMDFNSAEVVHSAFLKSPSHRKNILNPKYKDVGIGVVTGELNGHQTILLVEFFGTQRKDLSTLATAQAAMDNSIEPQTPPATEPEDIRTAGVTRDETNLFSQSNEGIIVVTTQQNPGKTLVDVVIEYSNIFFIAFLIFIFVSLALNIFVRIKIQHTSVILQTVVVLALLIAMIIVKFHFVEQVAPHILIL